MREIEQCRQWIGLSRARTRARVLRKSRRQRQSEIGSDFCTGSDGGCDGAVSTVMAVGFGEWVSDELAEGEGCHGLAGGLG
ncbi:hypothetical protein M0R45_006395 [Rubus argutus]|uniref:Uncharacterized protein n=1 Tax=Rubus argutus TaxID=59490 RepID=A0AAW1YQB3_RUBAR